MWEFLPLRQALGRYDFELSITERQLADQVGDDWFPRWGRSWVPFMTNFTNARLYVDCERVTPWRASPVRMVSWEWTEPEVDRAISLTHAAEAWVWVLEEGYCTWSGESRAVNLDSDSQPTFLSWTGLA